MKTRNEDQFYEMNASAQCHDLCEYLEPRLPAGTYLRVVHRGAESTVIIIPPASIAVGDQNQAISLA